VTTEATADEKGQGVEQLLADVPAGETPDVSALLGSISLHVAPAIGSIEIAEQAGGCRDRSRLHDGFLVQGEAG